jgi:hypothetical protein
VKASGRTVIPCGIHLGSPPGTLRSIGAANRRTQG